MKKHIIKTTIISAIIYIILCTLTVYIINFVIVSFISRAVDASILDKYFIGDKFESIFITENPSAAKAISFLMQDYKTDFNPDETNNDKSTRHGSKLISTTILYDNNGNILREGQIAPAFKYSDDKDIAPKDRRILIKNDIYGEIPLEYVFTKEQYEHALEIAEKTPNLDVKINSYYKVGNRFFPTSVSYYDGDTLLEEMNFEGNYEITDDMVYHEADGMLMALNMDNQQELISYKDSDVLELRDELKDYVNQKGFNEEVLHESKKGRGCIYEIITSHHPEMNVAYCEKIEFKPIITFASLIVNSALLIVISLITGIIILANRKKWQNEENTTNSQQ